MALKSTLINYQFGESTLIIDERYKNVGSSTFTLGDIKRAFIETDFSIEEGDSDGTVLTKDVDYEFTNKDTYYTSEEGENVWTGINILNAAYQNTILYITYRAIGSYTDKSFLETLRDDVDTNTTDIATLQANPALPANYIEGLEISNGTDTDHDIDIAIGRCKDSTGAVDLALSSPITIAIDASGANGLDTGSVGNDTFYYLYLIKKDSDGSIDGLFSASATSPTLPAGYTYFRRIRGAVLTDGSANILPFHQKDDYFEYTSPINDYTNLSPGTSRLTPAISIPPNFICQVGLTAVDSGSTYWWLRSTDQTDDAAAVGNCDMRTGNNQINCQKIIRADGSSQVAVRGDGAGSDIRVFTYGFFDSAQS